MGINTNSIGLKIDILNHIKISNVSNRNDFDNIIYDNNPTPEKSRCGGVKIANTDFQYFLDYLTKFEGADYKASQKIMPSKKILRPIINILDITDGYSKKSDLNILKSTYDSSIIKKAGNASYSTSSSFIGLESGFHNELEVLGHAPFDSFLNWFAGLSDLNRARIITSLLELQDATGVSREDFSTSVQLISTAFLQLVKGSPHLEAQFEIIEKYETLNAALFDWESHIAPMTSLADSFTQMVDLLSNLEVGQGCSLFRVTQISEDGVLHAFRALFKRTENGLTISLINTGYGAVRFGPDTLEFNRFELPRNLLAKPLISKCLEGLLNMGYKTASGSYEAGELNRQFRSFFNALVPSLQSDEGIIRTQTGGSCTFASWSRTLDAIVGEDVSKTLRVVLLSQIHQQIKGTPVGDQYCHQIRQVTERV
jgi:hypothetical protein